MINPILDKFPNTITVQDIKYTVNTDFRLWLRLFLCSKNKDSQGITKVLHDICGEIDTDNSREDFITALVDFSLLAEHLPPKSEKTKSRFNRVSKTIFDMFVDSDVIYADFMRDYKIDLNTVDMHWLKFKFLLNGLTSGSATEQRKTFRSTDLQDVNRKNRASVRRSQEILAIEDGGKMTLQERNKAMRDYVKSRQSDKTQ